MRADPIPKPAPKLGISHATREERECFTLFQQHDGRKRKTKDIPGWSPIPPIECRDGPDEACNETSETKQGEKPKQNAFDRIMTADQRRRSKKRSSKAVGNQDAEFDHTVALHQMTTSQDTESFQALCGHRFFCVTHR